MRRLAPRTTVHSRAARRCPLNRSTRHPERISVARAGFAASLRSTVDSADVLALVRFVPLLLGLSSIRAAQQSVLQLSIHPAVRTPALAAPASRGPPGRCSPPSHLAVSPNGTTNGTELPKAKDFWHHLNKLSRNRVPSPLKDLIGVSRVGIGGEPSTFILADIPRPHSVWARLE